MAKATSAYRKIVNFFFEVGTMRRLPRIHRQTLLVDDVTDTIASHSYRVALIGWHLAKMEKVDPYKVVMMCLLHDVGEARTGDHNWVHKRYIKVF
ncbi:MAG: HD domain-containing protein, partial [Candidatus Adlerbacteria bacterium]|nr:HD domain-containing protein [Candidatus Adlerbacteria bacterium]